MTSISLKENSVKPNIKQIGLECKQNFCQMQMTQLYKIVMLSISKKQYD